MDQWVCLDTLDLEQIGQAHERNARCVDVTLALEPPNMTLIILTAPRPEYTEYRLHYLWRLVRRGAPFFLKYCCLLESLELPVRITALFDFSGRVSQYDSGSECMIPVKELSHTFSSAA